MTLRKDYFSQDLKDFKRRSRILQEGRVQHENPEARGNPVLKELKESRKEGESGNRESGEKS